MSLQVKWSLGRSFISYNWTIVKTKCMTWRKWQGRRYECKAAAQQHYGHSFVMSSASPTDDDWDGNVAISEMEEPNREEGGRWRGCYPISSRCKRVTWLPNFRIIGKDHQLGKYSKQQIEYKLIDILVKVQYKSRGCTKKIEMDAVALFGERIGSLLLGSSCSGTRQSNTQQFQCDSKKI